MSGVRVLKLRTEPHLDAAPDARIRAAELEVDAVLKRYGVRFGISIIKHEGRTVHQEIVLVDERE